MMAMEGRPMGVLSVRLPRRMLEAIGRQAAGLDLRPADVARMALATGLKYMASQEQAPGVADLKDCRIPGAPTAEVL